MSELAVIVLGAVLANNFVLVRFLGLCPFFGTSARMETALGMSLATTAVLTFAAGAAALVETYLLVPFAMTHLRVLVLILIIASCVQLTELVLRHASPLLYRLLGIFLPLITTNCAVLGVALVDVGEGRGFLAATFSGFATGLGFALVLIAFAGLRARLATADVPGPFRGVPIALVTAGLMGIGFMGFTGLDGR